METSPQRRKEDTPVWLWRLQTAEYGPLPGRTGASSWQEVKEESRGADRQGPADPSPESTSGDGSTDSGPAHADDHALLIEKEGEDPILFLGEGVRRLERESRQAPRLPWLQDERSSSASDGAVVEEVTSWRAERDLQRRRMAMAKSFLVLTERVHRCRKRKELLDTLAELAHEVLESSTTLLYLREASTPQDGSDSGRLAPHPTPELRARRLILEPLPTEAMEGLCGPMVLTAQTLEGGEEPELAGLLDAMRGMEAASAAAVPLGEEGLLVVLERRQGRVFDDEDCFFLRSIARTVEERLARVHSGIK